MRQLRLHAARAFLRLLFWPPPPTASPAAPRAQAARPPGPDAATPRAALTFYHGARTGSRMTPHRTPRRVADSPSWRCARSSSKGPASARRFVFVSLKHIVASI
ncbi:hypothetical protein E2562_033430 [Oryza meyeriana var. granulata]|uniref:Secreted protein n=1 Tax=Oryza meyeriana var. granulata TaxID=110450 RepID=A0A6G1E6E0_9ORYZ|nr:hypothetical protein E2562_033430 [Oryza meyeriana var. granulata]